MKDTVGKNNLPFLKIRPRGCGIKTWTCEYKSVITSKLFEKFIALIFGSKEPWSFVVTNALVPILAATSDCLVRGRKGEAILELI